MCKKSAHTFLKAHWIRLHGTWSSISIPSWRHLTHTNQSCLKCISIHLYSLISRLDLSLSCQETHKETWLPTQNHLALLYRYYYLDHFVLVWQRQCSIHSRLVELQGKSVSSLQRVLGEGVLRMSWFLFDFIPVGAGDKRLALSSYVSVWGSVCVRAHFSPHAHVQAPRLQETSQKWDNDLSRAQSPFGPLPSPYCALYALRANASVLLGSLSSSSLSRTDIQDAKPLGLGCWADVLSDLFVQGSQEDGPPQGLHRPGIQHRGWGGRRGHLRLLHPGGRACRPERRAAEGRPDPVGEFTPTNAQDEVHIYTDIVSTYTQVCTCIHKYTETIMDKIISMRCPILKMVLRNSPSTKSFSYTVNKDTLMYTHSTVQSIHVSANACGHCISVAFYQNYISLLIYFVHDKASSHRSVYLIWSFLYSHTFFRLNVIGIICWI